MTISGAQSRAARGLLGWSQQELAERADVGLSVLRNLETGRASVLPASAERIRAALIAAGIVLIDENGGGQGVRLKRRSRPK